MKIIQRYHKCFLILTGLLFIISCENDFTETNERNVNLESESVEITFENIPWDEEGKQYEKFARGISQALQNRAFRNLLRNEALKQFNKDYDVLYHNIKNTPINASVYIKSTDTEVTFKTLGDFLVSFFDDEQDLENFENQYPLTTIFIPELPLDSFSAEMWDVNDENQIPDVAIRTKNITFVPVVSSHEEQEDYLVEPELIPAWPIVVIKENERVVASNQPMYDDLNTRIVGDDSSSRGKEICKGCNRHSFRYVDDNYDPVYKPKSGISGGITSSNFPQFLTNAYEVFRNDPTGWQRDNIYYGLTPTNTTGFSTGSRYEEHIASLKMTNTNPTEAYKSISNSTVGTNADPQLLGRQRRNGVVSAWTDGQFEFNIDAFFGAKNETVGAVIYKRVPVSPEDLFEIEYEQTRTGRHWWRRYYLTPKIIATKTFDLTSDSHDVRVPIATWELGKFSNQWKFEIAEVDSNVKIEREQTTKSTFNSNIELSGTYKKVGLKFGASAELERESSYKYSWTQDSDDLGIEVVDFQDQILNKQNNVYSLREYNTGRVAFTLVPIQVEF